MSQAYDVVFRERAVAAYTAGEGGYHDLARLFDIGYRTLQRWVAQGASDRIGGAAAGRGRMALSDRSPGVGGGRASSAG